MAIVRLTEANIKRIIRSAEGVLVKARYELPKPREKLDDKEFILKAYNTITGDIISTFRHIDTLGLGNVSAYTAKRKVCITGFLGDNRLSMYAPPSTHQDVPVPNDTIHSDAGTLGRDGNIHLERTFWNEEYIEATQRHVALTGMQRQHELATETLGKLLKQHGSLGPALRAYPPLWDMLPDDMKTEHKRKDIRLPSEKVEKTEIDFSELTAATISAKIILGSKE